MRTAETRGSGETGAVHRGAGADVVTWQEAEDALMAAVEYLFAMPDPEGALLAGGYGKRMSGWPQVIRSARDGDYGDGQGFGAEASPSPRLTRRMATMVDRMLTGERPLADAIPAGHRKLVGRVIVMKRWPGAEGFGWDRVWRAMGGALFSLRDQVDRDVTSDAMRKAYERAIRQLARRLDAASSDGFGR